MMDRQDGGTRATSMRPSARRTRLIAVTAILTVAACALWFVEADNDADAPGRTGVVVVPGVDNSRASETPAAGVAADRIVASEYNAAQPPPGGPGPEDTRPLPFVGSATFEPVQAQGRVTAFRLRGSGAAVTKAGFRNGDLIIAIDGGAIAELPPNIGEAELVALLAPGKSVEIVRDGQPVAWRIGGKAE